MRVKEGRIKMRKNSVVLLIALTLCVGGLALVTWAEEPPVLILDSNMDPNRIGPTGDTLKNGRMMFRNFCKTLVNRFESDLEAKPELAVS